MNPSNSEQPAAKKVFRPVDGLVLLDKPTGISSNHALQAVRRLYAAAKAGHTGALDPLASGMLPLCFGESTRLAGLLLNADKAYQTTATLGARSNTGDSDGELFDQRAVPEYSDVEIEAILAQFRGDQLQTPPMYSALKHKGQPLYKLARKGIEIERPPRAISIRSLALTGRSQNQLHLEIECTKGTYIRSLVEDIGAALGCGAHVSALRRTWVQGFRGQTMRTLEDLQQMTEAELGQCLLPTLAGLEGMARVIMDSEQTQTLCHGRPLFIRHGPVDRVALLDPDENLMAVAAVDDQGRVRVQARFGTRQTS